MSENGDKLWMVVNSETPCIKKIIGPSFNIMCVMWATDLTEKDYQEREDDLHLIAAAPRLFCELDDLICLAESAMREANRGGAEYDIDGELSSARRAIHSAKWGC